MKKEHYIRLKNHKAVIVYEDDEGMTLSVHVPGGHLLVSLNEEEALNLLGAINDIVNSFEEN